MELGAAALAEVAQLRGMGFTDERALGELGADVATRGGGGAARLVT